MTSLCDIIGEGATNRLVLAHTRSPNVLSVFMCLGALVCANASRTHAQSIDASQEKARMSPDELTAWHTSIDFGRSLVRAPAPGEKIDLQYSDLPKRLRSQLWSDIGLVMRKAARPHSLVDPLQVKDGLNATVRVFAARKKGEDDLVEYQWTYQDKSITVLVSRNARRIEFDLSEVPECRKSRGHMCTERVKPWVEGVVEVEGVDRFEQEYGIAFPWPTELLDGVIFSSAPGFDITKAFRWHNRLDAEVNNGILAVLIYKRFPHDQGGYPDGSEWFPDDFRAEIHERARKLGKLPPEPEGEED